MPTWHAGKRIARTTLHRSGLLPLAARFAAPRAAVIMYHSVQEDPERCQDWIGRGIIHPLTVFEKQMERIVRRYAPLGLDELLYILGHHKPLPRKAVVVTFDDGYLDNVACAAPVMDRLRVPGAFYVVVGCIEDRKLPWFCHLRHAFAVTRRDSWNATAGARFALADPAARRQAFRAACERCARLTGTLQEQAVLAIERDLGVEQSAGAEGAAMMDWEDLRALRRAGHVVGSHTMTHPNLAHIGEDDLAWELGESKARLEKHLGETVAHFSYPHPILDPHWNERTVRSTERHGFSSVVTTTPGPVRPGDPPLLLRRINAGSDLDEFAWKVERTHLGIA